MPRTAIAAVQPADKTASSSDTAPAKSADPPAAAQATANSGTAATREEVAAALAAVAIPAPAIDVTGQKSNSTDPDHFAAVQSGAAEKTVAAPREDTGGLVALLMARPEISAVSDLANKDIAIDDKISASSAGVRAAMAAAGATETQLSEADTDAIDRLVGGEVTAAVLALVSPEAAERFPEIEGFKIFRIPLSPR